jgi:hypothetical protein
MSPNHVLHHPKSSKIGSGASDTTSLCIRPMNIGCLSSRFNMPLNKGDSNLIIREGQINEPLTSSIQQYKHFYTAILICPTVHSLCSKNIIPRRMKRSRTFDERPNLHVRYLVCQHIHTFFWFVASV